MIDKTREIALKILYKIDQEKAYSNIALDEMLEKHQKELTNQDIGLICEIVYGVTTWRLTIDEIIKKYSKIKIKKISPWILNSMRMGIYQIVWLDKIPKSAAVNEAVNLAKRYGHASSSNFVNAILRKVEKIDYEEFFKIKDPIEKISKTTAMPMWMVEEILKQKKKEKEETAIEKTQMICQYSNQRPDLNVRINTLKIKQEELKKELEEEKIEVQEGLIQDFIILKKAKKIEEIKSFQEGKFIVQDEMAGLTALLLDPRPEDMILDACSSPGGKTTYLAQIMKDKGRIEAWDIYPHRIKLVEENAKRLGIKSITTKVQDASIYQKEQEEKFDKILLDVPCLGLGVLKRKPDIKWQRTKEDIR